MRAWINLPGGRDSRAGGDPALLVQPRGSLPTQSPSVSHQIWSALPAETEQENQPETDLLLLLLLLVLRGFVPVFRGQPGDETPLVIPGGNHRP